MSLANPSQTLERTAAAIQVHAGDNVAVALRPIAQGEDVEVAGRRLAIRDAIEQGHKFALDEIAVGEIVRKFGWEIGAAVAPIRAGEHVHTHNLKTLLKGEERYGFEPLDPPALPTSEATFMGYRRSDGRVGTRNEIWVLPTVGCVARTAQRIATTAHARHSGAVDGVHAFAHPFGCSQLGDDLAGTRSVLAALACNPNAGGVVVIGLGCESNQLDALVAEIPKALRGRVRTLRAQSEEDETETGLALVDELVREAAQVRRERVPISELVVGLKCGGSDGFSGLTANPLVGRISDVVVGSGGSTLVIAVPEIFGAERV